MHAEGLLEYMIGKKESIYSVLILI